MKASFRLIFLSLGTLFFLFGAGTFLRSCGMAREYEAKKHPLLEEKFPIIATSGGAGEAPENTFQAFDHAKAQKAWIHFDLRLTKDNRLVVMKDATLDRTTSSRGWIAEKTVSELHTLGVPTFESMLERYNNNVLVMELHENSLPAALYIAEKVSELKLDDRVVFLCRHAGPLEEIRKVRPQWLTLSPLDEVERLVMLSSLSLESIAKLRGDFFLAPLKKGNAEILTQKVVNEVHRRKKKVIASEVNDLASLQSVMALGVDGVASDHPELLRGTIESRP